MLGLRHTDLLDARVRLAGPITGLIFAGIVYPLGTLIGFSGTHLILAMLSTGAVAGVVSWRFSAGLFESSEKAVQAFAWPSGRAQHAYSHERSLVERGLIDEALFAYETALLSNPTDPLLQAEMAEACAAHGRSERAAELFAELREIATTPRSQSLYASQRLIDLCLGSLGDERRARVEMRRLIELFPGTTEADGARQALARHKIGRGSTDAGR
jgi:Flp pilus assembly protein TadD